MSTLADGMAISPPALPPASEAAPSPPAQLKPARSGRSTTPTHLSRHQILEATAGCLQECGYDGTTIRRIASRLRCAVGSIYRYFSDKRTLLGAVTQRRFEPVEQAVQNRVPLARTVQMYARIATAAPEQYRLMFWLSSIGQSGAGMAAPPVPPVISNILGGWARQLGNTRSAQRLWSQLHGSIMLSIPTVDLVGQTLPSRHIASPTTNAEGPIVTILRPSTVLPEVRPDLTPDDA